MFKIHNKILDENQLDYLKKWLLNYFDQTHPGIWQGCGAIGGTKRFSIYESEQKTGSESKFCFVPKVIPSIFYKLRETAFVLTKSKKSYVSNCVANVEFLDDGCFVPNHIDDNYGNGELEHVRFNVLISKPDQGGMPIISNSILQIEEGDAWSFFANKHYHSCEKVVGCNPRISISFGFLGDKYC